MPIHIYVDSRGTPLVAADPHDTIRDQDWRDAETLLEKLAPMLSPGTHPLSAVADAITRERPDSVVASASAQELREIERRYQAPVKEVPQFVRHAEHREGVAYVCGDIHGQYRALMEELKRVGFDRQRDILYCTGDLVDRGSDSFDCLSLAFEPWFHGCLGNHERMAWDALRDGVGASNAWDHWQANGGSWVYLEGAHEVRSILGEALRYLPLAREITVGDYQVGLCHAEPPPDWQAVRDNPERHIDRLTWGRARHRQHNTTPVEGIDAVIVGHTIVADPTWIGNTLYLDTGAFTRDGYLTLLPLQEVVDSIL